ncbi:MAG: hypothetical protein BYD32DRAFT_489327 [Podila humilis]|nr:MAG: hypothetical protein BYD32DRAFT_489327 [Podila humilis]
MRAKLFPSERFLSQVEARQLTDQGSSDCQKNAVGEATLYHLQRSFGNTMALSFADPQVALFLAYSLENMQRQIKVHRSGVSHLKNPITDNSKKGHPSNKRQKSTREQAIDIFKATTNSNKKSQSSEKARSNSKKKSNKKNKSQKLTT